MNKTVIAQELVKLAKNLTAGFDGLAISTSPQMNFGMLYYQFNARLSGAPVSVLVDALRKADNAMWDKSVSLVKKNKGISFDGPIEINSLERNSFTLSLQFSKPVGMEIVE